MASFIADSADFGGLVYRLQVLSSAGPCWRHPGQKRFPRSKLECLCSDVCLW